MSAFVEALRSVLALYGLGSRAQRRRPAPVCIGRPGAGRI
jgi:hypothetical protein